MAAFSAQNYTLNLKLKSYIRGDRVTLLKLEVSSIDTVASVIKKYIEKIASKSKNEKIDKLVVKLYQNKK